FYVVLLPFAPSLRSSLFPYTTLFRSRSVRVTAYADRLAVILRSKLQDERRRGLRPRFGLRVIRRAVRPARAQHVGVDHARVQRQDRKSTRLNSSHVKISYAVFCLKKK